MEELIELDRIYYETLLPQEEILLASLTKLQSDERQLQLAIQHATTDRRAQFLAQKQAEEAAAEARLRDALLLFNNDNDDTTTTSDDDDDDDDDDNSNRNDPKQAKADLHNLRGTTRSSSSSSSNSSAFGCLKNALLKNDNVTMDADDDSSCYLSENSLPV